MTSIISEPPCRFLPARGYIARLLRRVGFAGLTIVTLERLAPSKTRFTASIGETR
jgi:hypothetical protein